MQHILLGTEKIYAVEGWTPSRVVYVEEDAVSFGGFLPASFEPRRFCRLVITNAYVQWCWYLFVFISIAVPLTDQPQYNMGIGAYYAFNILRLLCVCFFWLRMTAEMVASGLFSGQYAFLKSGWNWLELGVNLCALLNVIPPMHRNKWLGAAAAVRPLRFFPYVFLWKPLLVPLVRGCPSLIDATATLLLSLFALGVVGVQIVGSSLNQLYLAAAVDTGSSDSSLMLSYELQQRSTLYGARAATIPSISSDTSEQCLYSASAVQSAMPFFYSNSGSALALMLKLGTLDRWYKDVDDTMRVSGPAAALYVVVVVLVALLLFAVAMAVLLSAYRRFSTLSTAPGKSGVVPAAQERSDAGSQTEPPRLHSRQQSLIRSARSQSHSHNFVDCGLHTEETHQQNPFSAAAALTSQTATAPSRDTVERRKISFPLRRRQLMKFCKIICAMEQTAVLVTRKRTIRYPTIVSILCSPVLAGAVILLSSANAALLASVAASTSATSTQVLNLTSSAISVVLGIPVLLKMVEFRVKTTLADVWNDVDLLAAATGLLELAASSLFHHTGVRALRACRVMRLGKYVSAPLELRRPCRGLVALFLLVLAILVLYTVVGMNLFGHAPSRTAAADLNSISHHFSTTWNALYQCFTVFSGAHWTADVHQAWRDGPAVTGLLYFISLRCLGLLFLTALAYAILFDALSESHRVEVVSASDAFPPLLILPSLQDDVGGTALVSRHVRRASSIEPLAKDVEGDFKRELQGCRVPHIFGVPCVVELRTHGNFLKPIPPIRAIRRQLLAIFGSLWYTISSLVCVAAGVVALFFEGRNLDSHVESPLRIFNIVYCAIFSIEMFLKWVAYGVSLHSPDVSSDDGEGRVMEPYFRYPLNWVDCAANLLSFAAIFYTPLRVGRVIRTWRLCTTQERPNRSFTRLIQSMHRILRVVPLILWLFLVLALLGMQLMSGGLHYCTDPSISVSSGCVGSLNVTVMGDVTNKTTLVARDWRRWPLHYDAIGPALLSVLVLGTVNDWPGAMSGAPSSVSPTGVAFLDPSWYYVVYSVAVVLLIRCFALRTIAAEFAAYLGELIHHTEGNQLWTLPRWDSVCSRDWIAYFSSLHRLFDPLPNVLSRRCHFVLYYRPAFTRVPLFASLQMVFVLADCGFLSATHADEPLWLATLTQVIHCCTIGVCVAEALLLVVTHGIRHLCSGFYLLDIALIAAMIAGSTAPELRWMRCFVFVKLLKCCGLALSLLPCIRHAALLCTVLGSYLILLLTYSVVGTLLFGLIRPDGVSLSEYRNFGTVTGSLLVLFDCSTSDQWQQVMQACFNGAACRDGSSSSDCGSTPSAILFFVTFAIFVTITAVQLCTAAVVVVTAAPINPAVVQPFQQLRRTWEEAVGFGSSTSSLDELVALLPSLPATLTNFGTGSCSTESETLIFLSSLWLPLDERLRVTYRDIVCGLAYQKYGVQLRQKGHRIGKSRRQRFCLTAADLYAQRPYQRSGNSISPPTHTEPWTSDAVDTSPSQATTAIEGPNNDMLRYVGDDLLVPNGAIPIPSCNLFLFGLPGEVHPIP